MKKLLILSGKGGSGKTTVAAAFIDLLNVKALADCDVDAPNLHLVMEMKSLPERKDYYGLQKSAIDTEKMCCLRRLHGKLQVRSHLTQGRKVFCRRICLRGLRGLQFCVPQRSRGAL